MVEELTLALFHIAQRANHVEASCWAAASATTRLRYLSEARRMYDQGWRKGGSDE
jgi:hypothetical protein